MLFSHRWLEGSGRVLKGLGAFCFGFSAHRVFFYFLRGQFIQHDAEAARGVYFGRGFEQLEIHHGSALGAAREDFPFEEGHLMRQAMFGVKDSIDA
jgi:hypothetical protein